MNQQDIVRLRLHNQHLSEPRYATPGEVVAWQGAVQSQDYAGAKWAVGQRLVQALDSDIERAFNEGTLLRTHVLRPTWHFVAPEDIRWMLALTAPRVHALNALYYRKLELNKDIFSRSHTALTRALEGGKELTRAELRMVFQEAGIATDDLRFTYLMMEAELEALVCSGSRRGKQFTYALLDERAPQAKTLEREEAVAELVLRYFQSHGPATVQDFVWWSGLTVADGRAGLQALGNRLVRETSDGKEYWLSSSPLSLPTADTKAHLLPNYDECLASFRDKGAPMDAAHADEASAYGLLFPHLLVVHERLVGMWKRTITKTKLTVGLHLFRPLSDEERLLVEEAAERYGRFLQVQASVVEP